MTYKFKKGADNLTLFKRQKGGEKSACEMHLEAAPRHKENEYFRLERGLCEKELYYSLREQVPVIDACLKKITRLIGGFKAVTDNESFQPCLDKFTKEVRVGSSGSGLNAFIDCYMDSLLTSGSALCEIIYDRDYMGVSGIYTAPMKRIEIRQRGGEREYYILGSRNPIKINHPENLIFTALSPTPEQPYGVSLLQGLPSLSAILLRIYDCIGQNFDRVGNVRYAVTYKPSGEYGDRAYSREHAEKIAKEWALGMSASKSGDIRDFIAVGDVSIKAIGADNQIIDTEVPVRQILEQLISKLGIPPYLLGFHWSTSERMSSQQADILTSELEYYRRLITPALEKICSAHLRLLGSLGDVTIEWENINLQDETETALARLRNAQARAIELSNIKEEKALGQ